MRADEEFSRLQRRLRLAKAELAMAEEQLADAQRRAGILDSGSIVSGAMPEDAELLTVAETAERSTMERLAELAKANDALRRSVDSLVDLESIDAFLGVSLRTIAEVLEVPSACFWKQDKHFSYLCLVYQDGVVIPGEKSNHPNANQPAPHDTQVSLDGAGSLRRDPYLAEVEDQRIGFSREQRQMFRNLGVRALINIPILLGDRTVASITARLTHSMPDPTPSRLELIRALSSQAALAMQMSELAQQARQAAVAREQERAAKEQVAELARVNEAMRRSLDRLAQAADLAQLRPGVVETLIQVLGAVSGSLWMYNEDDGSVSLQLEYAEGRFLDRLGSGFAHAERHFFYPEHAGSYDKHLRLIAGEMLTVEVATSDIFVLNERDHLLSQGVLTLILIPLAAAGHHLGRFALAFAEERSLSASERELALALANQMSLIMETTNLAEQAKAAAVAEVREKAALEKAGELIRANRAISSSLAKLTACPDLESFLGQVMVSIASEVGESDGDTWLWEADEDRLVLRLVLIEGEIQRSAAPSSPWLYFESGNSERNGSDGVQPRKGPARHKNEVKVHTWEEIESLAEWDRYRESLRAGRFRCVMEIPMFAGADFIGYYTIRARNHTTFSASEIELVQALANQAALACYLQRLSDLAVESAHQSAIVEERNRLAREIHDTLAQGFAAIGMQLQGATRERASLPRAVRPYLERALEIAKDNLAEARRSVGSLRAQQNSSGGFVPTLTRIVEQARRSGGVAIDLNLNSQPASIPRKVEDEFLRIAQEAISNATKHSDAERITIEIRAVGQGLRLKIQDDGTGFDADIPTAGYGLGIMQERAKRVGATLTLVTAPNSGTEVIAIWTPLERGGV